MESGERLTGTPDGFASLDDAISRYRPHRPRLTRLDGLAKNLRLQQDGKYQ